MRWIIVGAGLLTVLAGCRSLTGAEQANKVLATRAFQEILSSGQYDRAEQFYDPTFVNHGLHVEHSLKEDLDAARAWREAFPDATIEVRQVLAEKDLVCVLWVARGTNTGAGGGLPATGKAAELRGITIWRIRNARIVEEWSAFDQLSLLRQLGLLPAGY